MASVNLDNSAQTFEPDRNLIAGRYRTQSRIGRGRLGEIFAAIDESVDKPGDEPQLAIQVIPESVVRNNKLFNKLGRGYAMLRAAAHPNIVSFRDFGRDGRIGYLVMDLLDGLSVRSVIEDDGTTEPDETKMVVRAVGEALRVLHARDMVHGNVATSNVFVTHELEVRLLDVLPLDSAEPILCNSATGEPFNRCTVEDDVFDLACLAYEMLAGEHPFNHKSPAEARLAGLEAHRIASLTYGEWSALHRALSFDREQRTSSVAEFVLDFGVGSAESLSATDDHLARHESVTYPTVAETQPLAELATPAQSVEAEAPVGIEAPLETEDSFPWDDMTLPIDRPTREHVSPLRAMFLLMLLAGLGAWFYYGQPGENIADWISTIEENIDVRLTESNAEPVEVSTPDPAPSVATDDVAQVEESAPSVSTDEVAPLEEPADTAPEVAVEEMPADEVEQLSEPETVATIEETEEVVADFIAPTVSVSEHAGAARIAPPRTENSAMPLIWWTSEHTAVADSDFIAVEQQPIGDASIEDGTMLFVPLVNDDQPEAPESFFVNFGLRNTQQGQIERIATVRVDITDDD